MAENMAADILRPAAEEIGKSIVANVKRQFNYLCCFQKNIANMRDETEDLENERRDLQGKVDSASRGGEVILTKVNTWLTSTDEIQVMIRDEIEGMLPNAENGCLNIKARYLLSKKAKEATEAMEKHRKKVSEFHTIANPALPSGALPFSLRTRLALESRNEVEDKIVEDFRRTLALESRKQMGGDVELLSQPKVNIVGITGMGGLGKTTMAENIMTRLMKEKLIEEAVKVVVGRPTDLLRIQDDIARQLGFLEKLEEELGARSRQLLSRLTNTKKVVILLDDIWEEIELADLGIPREGGCITVLTSRYKDLLNQMGAQVYSMDTLSMDESWSLFKYGAGTCVDDRLSIAGEVVRECKGWPIAIVTIGKALKDKPEQIWNGVLHRLKLSRPIHIEDTIKDVYNPLRQSYELLGNEDAQYLFLLCSLFPEDYDIRLEDLVSYSMGLKMFKGVQTLEEGRYRVWEGVEKLKGCFLLLDVDGSNGNKVKMHDVIRDVAIFIASEKGLVDGQNCKWRSVFQSSRYDAPFDRFMESNFQSLSLLIIRGKWSWNSRINEGMQELNVLSLTDMTFDTLPQLVKSGKKLQTLELNQCTLYDLSPVVGLSNLVILKCYNCRRIKELALEIGGLKFLKLLDLSDCTSLRRIPAGVISKLVELQELKMLNSFKAWESSKVAEEYRENAGITELESLSKLKCLEIQIEDVHLVEEEMIHFPKVLKYKIFVGGGVKRKYEREMVLSGLPDDISLGNWIRGIVNTTQKLYLHGYGSKDLDLSQAHSTIRELKIQTNRMLKELVDTSNTSTDWGELGVFPMLEHLTLVNLSALNRVCGGRIPKGSVSFKKLRKLELRSLPALTQLWESAPNDDAFLQLETLEIEYCEAMEHVFLSDEKDEHGKKSSSSITFPKLWHLKLGGLTSLTAFWKGTKIIEFPSLEYLEIWGTEQLKSLVVPSVHNCAKGSPDDGDDENHKCGYLLCGLKVKFGGLKSLTLGNYNVSNIWCCQIPKCFFTTLETLKIWNSLHIQSLFSLSIAKNLVRLNFLEIYNCNNMENLLRKEKNEAEREISHITFPNLEILAMDSLSNLKSLGEGIESIEFSELKVLEIKNCPKLMKGIINDSTTKSNEREGEGMSNHDCDCNCKCLHLFCPKLKRRFDSTMATTCNNKEEEGDGRCNHEDELQPLLCHKKIKLGGLDRITIDDCDNITSLFSSSMIENPASLRVLEITNCKHMEKVIACEEETLHENCKRFPSLHTLRLTKLPSLGVFCEGRCALEFPLMRFIEFIDCPHLEFLNLGSISTPTLCRMELDKKIFDEEQLEDMEDLNSVLGKHLMSAAESETNEDIMKLTRKTELRIEEDD